MSRYVSLKSLLDPLAYLILPALINGVGDNVVEVAGVDAANEEDFHVVLHGDQFRVVDTGLPGKLFAGGSDLQANGFEAQLRLALKRFRLAVAVVNNPMLIGLHSSLFASLSHICEDRTESTRQHM